MKHILSFLSVIVALTSSNSSFAGIALSRDSKSGCDLYRITTTENPAGKTEELVSEAYASGFSMRNAAINFESKSVKIDVVAVVRIGFNDRPAGKTTWISANQTNFHALLNSLNRTVFLYSKVCIAPSGQIL